MIASKSIPLVWWIIASFFYYGFGTVYDVDVAFKEEVFVLKTFRCIKGWLWILKFEGCIVMPSGSAVLPSEPGSGVIVPGY